MRPIFGEYVNKHNCRIWNNSNPHEIQKRIMNLGELLFDEDLKLVALLVDQAITANGKHYRSKISNSRIRCLVYQWYGISIGRLLNL